MEGGQGRDSNREGAWIQEWKQMPRRDATHWLVLCGSLSFVFYKSQDPTCPELVPPTVGLVHPLKSFIKKVPHRLPPGAI